MRTKVISASFMCNSGTDLTFPERLDRLTEAMKVAFVRFISSGSCSFGEWWEKFIAPVDAFIVIHLGRFMLMVVFRVGSHILRRRRHGCFHEGICWADPQRAHPQVLVST